MQYPCQLVMGVCKKKKQQQQSCNWRVWVEEKWLGATDEIMTTRKMITTAHPPITSQSRPPIHHSPRRSHQYSTRTPFPTTEILTLAWINLIEKDLYIDTQLVRLYYNIHHIDTARLLTHGLRHRKVINPRSAWLQLWCSVMLSCSVESPTCPTVIHLQRSSITPGEMYHPFMKLEDMRVWRFIFHSLFHFPP